MTEELSNPIPDLGFPPRLVSAQRPSLKTFLLNLGLYEHFEPGMVENLSGIPNLDAQMVCIGSNFSPISTVLQPIYTHWNDASKWQAQQQPVPHDLQDLAASSVRTLDTPRFIREALASHPLQNC